MGLFDGTALERPVVCERCGRDVKLCDCPPLQAGQPAPLPVAPSRQRLKIGLEKRKRGKLMTVVSGFSGSEAQLRELLSELKQSCGAGGTVVEQCLEIQGEQQTRVRNALLAKGYQVL